MPAALVCDTCGASPAKSYPLKKRPPRILCAEHEAARQRRRACWFAAMERGFASKGGNSTVARYWSDPNTASAHGWRLANKRWSKVRAAKQPTNEPIPFRPRQ